MTLFMLASCSSEDARDKEQKEASTKQATEEISQNLPKTKDESILIEGQKKPTNLTLYNDKILPFYTYYSSADFEVNNVDSPQDGRKARFVSKNSKDVFLEIFLPPNQMNVEDLSKSVKSDKGVIKQNNWRIFESRKEVSYPWVKEKITIGRQTGKVQTVLGDVLIGEDKGRAFYVIEHFPGEYVEAFGPRFHLILDNLRFKD
jgi:hypothetical protein